MTIREEFFIERQGKRMVLYAGLLEEAHNRGLRAITTELLQVPADDNGMVAIAKARVVMDVLSEPDHPMPRYLLEHGNEEGARGSGAYTDGDHPARVACVFEGIGDASPENVGRNIAPHIIRMAETRAKARALRDAINVGVVSSEEMGDDGDDQAAGGASPAAAPARNGGTRNGNQSSKPANGNKHEQLLEEIAQVYQRLPEDRRPDKNTMWPYAREKIGNARVTLDDLKARETEAKEAQGV